MNNKVKLLDFGLSTRFYENDVLSRQTMYNANYLKEVSGTVKPANISYGFNVYVNCV